MESPDWYDPAFDEASLMVGKICGCWAALETTFDQVTWELANIEATAGVCFTAQMIGPGPRAKLFVSLVGLRGADGKLLGDANDLANKFIKLGAKRNRYVHDSLVLTTSGKIHRTEFSADRKMRSEHIPFDMPAAHKLWTDSRALQIELWGFRERLISELPPWPRTQYSQSRVGIRRRPPAKELPE